jgi:hypothetical protein
MCVDWVVLLPGVHHIERRVDFSRITPIPNQTGTADFIACAPGRMVIADWKFGKGVVVHAEGNTQGLLYALGAFYEFDHLYHFDVIEIRIAMPRLGHFDTWEISRAELLEFAEFARGRAMAAWQPDAPRMPSVKSCQWCKVKATCPANAKLQADLMAAAFDDLDGEVTAEQMLEFKEDLIFTAVPKVASVTSLTTDELATLYGFRKMADGWWNALANELYRRAIAGEQVNGYKLVESRSRRLFRNPEKAADKLEFLGLAEGDLWTKSLASPSQAEALLKKAGWRAKELPELLEDLVFKPVGKATLAPASDKRPAIVDLSAVAFDDLIENPEVEDEEI